MAVFGRIYLDTNIFIMAFENNESTGTLLSNLLASTSHPAEARFATSELTLSELLVKPYKHADDSAIDKYDGLIRSSEWLEVLPVVRPTLWYASILRSQNGGLKMPDAIHISTAIGARCTHLLTDDRGIKGEYELEHYRYGITKRAAPLTVIRPDEPTLTALIESLSA